MKWNEEKLRTYSETRKSGATAEEIAAVLGCDKNAVYTKTKELNRKNRDTARTDDMITATEPPKPEPLVTLKPEYKRRPRTANVSDAMSKKRSPKRITSEFNPMRLTSGSAKRTAEKSASTGRTKTDDASL